MLIKKIALSLSILIINRFFAGKIYLSFYNRIILVLNNKLGAKYELGYLIEFIICILFIDILFYYLYKFFKNKFLH